MKTMEVIAPLTFQAMPQVRFLKLMLMTIFVNLSDVLTRGALVCFPDWA